MADRALADEPWWNPIPEEEFQNILVGMERAEKDGFFDGLFKPPERPVRYEASKEQLLQSISPGMNLTKSFFKRTYGYEITNPGFAELVISKLEEAGCSRAGEYYDMIKNGCDQEYNEMLGPVAEWYSNQLEEQWKQEDKKKGSEEPRKQSEVELMKPDGSQKWLEGLY